MNTYAPLHILKIPSILNLTDDAHDARLLMLAENVSRQIDRYCNRHFYCLKATRVFDGRGGDTLLVPDLISIDPAGLKTDDDLDGAFETAWPDSDYLLYPANADPAAGLDISSPYTKLVVNTTSGLRESFPDGRRAIRVSGQWGYWIRLWTAEGSLEEDLDTDETDITLTAVTGISPGHTIQIDSEQMYVREIVGHTLTITRAVNGTTATTHQLGDKVSLFAYPGPVTEATILQVSQLWRNNPLDWDLPRGSADARAGLHPHARHLLSSYRKPPTPYSLNPKPPNHTPHS